MPAFCFLNSVSMAADQTSASKQVAAAHGTFSFQIVTRQANGTLVVGPTPVNFQDQKLTFTRVRWELATTTVFIDGSNTLRTDEWTTLAALPIAVGLATLLTVTLG